MNKSIIKIGAIALLIICSNSIPTFAYEKNVNADVKISNQDEFQAEDNWLNREVAAQLNKDLKDITEQDFLSIKRIDLHYKKIEGEIPKSIGLLKNLEYLNLDYCRLTKVPENILELKKLTYLDLGDNKFRDLPEEFEKKIIKGEYPYVDVEGKELTLKEDWYFLKGKWFHMDSRGDKLTGLQEIDGKAYRFSEDGSLKTGWDQVDGKWHYYDKAGSTLKNAWKLINGKWYYFNEKEEMQTGLVTIKSNKYYLNENGEMFTGWKVIDGKSYFFDGYGVMKHGWLEIGDEKYYFDDNGVMAAGQEVVIDGKKYKFYAEGTLAKNMWVDNYTYVQPNGEVANTYYNYSHSNTQYNAFKYMTDVNNQVSVHNTAISLHNGVQSNNCVYFLSEILRRNSVALPSQTCNTYQLERELQSRGFVASYDFTQLKPGDIIFTNGYTHVYMFMCWKNSEYAYIVDNQREKFENNILHIRNVLYDDSQYDTDRATHFYYYPY
ncbi:leucine-rich repeat domain-containing protein [Clostridium uliginosum]|uniref:Glucan-binding domain-containing protein (YG repeat) n=1 Tax=Clostridium uliginosum TaxID=119641 RepID=A0A1I1S8X2_9CLOT|nr:leucine-rich repeat domain-containing protein [Clostridium uliginosum]SFD41058.1 Glucan-binding domain-containing protein (YG repeat) [Clostridium uliginosum]